MGKKCEITWRFHMSAILGLGRILEVTERIFQLILIILRVGGNVKELQTESFDF